MPDRHVELHIRAADRSALIAHAQAAYPAEACGIIGGTWRSGTGTASIIIPLANIASVPTVRYAIDPRAFLAAYAQIEAIGSELIAIYHSHPHGDPIPSATDMAEATWPDAAYVIVGLREYNSPQVAAWQIRRGQVTPITLMVNESTPAGVL